MNKHEIAKNHAANTLAPYSVWSEDSEGTLQYVSDYANAASAKAQASLLRSMTGNRMVTIRVFDNGLGAFVTHPSWGASN